MKLIIKFRVGISLSLSLLIISIHIFENAFAFSNSESSLVIAKRNAMLRDYLIKNPKPSTETSITGIVLCTYANQGFVGARGAAFCCTNPSSYWCRVGAAWLNTMDQQNGGSTIGPNSSGRENNSSSQSNKNSNF